MDILSAPNLIVAAPLLAWSMWFYRRTTTAAREDWLSNGPHSPQVIAAMMSRLGWLERRRLRRALNRRG